MVVLYFFPIFVAIAVLVSFARRNRSGQKPSGLQIVAALLIALALAGLAFWLAVR
jgi:uncharacterized membrane protein YoaK (UPF0700 family)